MSNSATKRVGMDLTQGNIFKQLMIFVVPMLLANIVQQLYNTVDMIVIGQFVGPEGTVGVSQGGEITSLVTFMASAIGSASQIYIAQLFGAGKKQEITEAIMTSLVFTILLSVFSMVVCMVCCDIFLTWLNCPQEAFSQAHDYMMFVSLGLPFIFGYNTVCGILRGLGESKRPLYFIIVAAVANIFMDLLLVCAFRMEAAGTAIATAAAQLASFIAAFIFLYKRREAFGIVFRFDQFRMKAKHLGVLLELGIPLVLSSAFIHGTQLICSARINAFGLVPSAANSIGNKVQKLVNVFSSSINQGAGAMVGQNIGAKKFDRVKKIVYTAVACTGVCSLLAIGVSVFIPRLVLRMFTTDPDVIELGVTYMHICILTFLIVPVHGSYNAVISGSGNARLGFIGSMLDGVILRIGVSFLLAYTFGMGIEGFFYGNAIGRLGPTLIGIIYFYSGRWKTRKLLSE